MAYRGRSVKVKSCLRYLPNKVLALVVVPLLPLHVLASGAKEGFSDWRHEVKTLWQGWE